MFVNAAWDEPLSAELDALRPRAPSSSERGEAECRSNLSQRTRRTRSFYGVEQQASYVPPSPLDVVVEGMVENSDSVLEHANDALHEFLGAEMFPSNASDSSIEQEQGTLSVDEDESDPFLDTQKAIAFYIWAHMAFAAFNALRYTISEYFIFPHYFAWLGAEETAYQGTIDGPPHRFLMESTLTSQGWDKDNP